MQESQSIQLTDLLEKNKKITALLKENVNKSGAKKQIKLGRYTLQKVLGQGAFGEVYKGIHDTTKREVAIKLIDIAEMNRKNKSTEVRRILKKLLETEEILMKKCNSANVVKCFQCIGNADYKIYILEYCNDGSLDEYLCKVGALSEEDSIVILKQIILGLAELHRNNIIHRDLKPQNILIHNGIYKLADFGFSKEIQNQNQQGVFTMLGTKSTMSPEVVRRQPYGLKADIWSIGVIFFMMVCAEGDYKDRWMTALEMANQKKFVFKNNQKELRSKEVGDFISKVLEKDQNLRLNWLQMLEHPMFYKAYEKQQQNKLSQKFIMPVQNKNLKDLQEGIFEDKPKKYEQYEQSYEVQSQQQQQSIHNKETILISKKNEQKSMSPQKLPQKFQIDPQKQAQLYKTISDHLLQCRKAEYILDNIIVPIEKMNILHLNDNRRHIQLMYLMAFRCNSNVSWSKNAVLSNFKDYLHVIQAYEKQIQFLFERTKEKKQKYNQLLRKCEDNLSQIMSDKLSSWFSSSKKKKKDFMLGQGFQKHNFQSQQDHKYYYTPQMQIDYTQEQYINYIINEMKGSSTEQELMRDKFKAYKLINQIMMKDLKYCTLENRIKDILKELNQ